MAGEARAAGFVSRTIFPASGKWSAPQSATNATLPVVANSRKNKTGGRTLKDIYYL